MKVGTVVDGGRARGTEDANRNGIRDAPGGVYNESSPLSRDSDGDGSSDYEEVKGTWCYLGEGGSCGSSPNAARYTNASNPDTDGDGLLDGPCAGEGGGQDGAVKVTARTASGAGCQ